jgi:glycogen debranching enzyme
MSTLLRSTARDAHGWPAIRREAVFLARDRSVWAWWLGPFARAHFRLHGDGDRALSYLEPMADHLGAAGVGSVSEIFDGDPPHAPRGCIAQAWSVAQVLAAWTEISGGTLKRWPR